jgi:cytochrome c oxidase cbb3-type subunit 2
MNQFRTFVLILAGTFAVPWFLLLIQPSWQLSKITPVPVFELDENGVEVLDDDGNRVITGYYPPLASGSRRQGHEIYVRQGCAQCHSQMIRSDRLTFDAYKRDWGSAPNSPIPVRTRPVNALDYMNEDLPSIGNRRGGGDLSNLAHRFSSRADLHLVLYDSRIGRPSSNMPAYRFLYKSRKIEGSGPSERALALTGDLAPEEGHEIIPSDDAEALVDYLLALRKDYTDPRKDLNDGQ